MKKTFLALLSFLLCMGGYAQQTDIEFSTAGFFTLPNSGRTVSSFNPAWRFHKGAIANGWQTDLDDSQWEVVSLPHSTEYLPKDASGSINYQGETWYRKHFTLPPSLKGKKIFLHFEAIMGKSKLYLNGKLLKSHFGGFLPLIVDITDHIIPEKENLIALWADNSNDADYPPGKPQEALDFTYFGGIYRDVWLIAHNDIYISDPNFQENKKAGLTVSYSQVSDKSANIQLDLGVKNEQSKKFKGKIKYQLISPQGNTVRTAYQKLRIPSQANSYTQSSFSIKQPQLWSPDTPQLYELHITLLTAQGEVIDGYRQKIGIRSIDFKGKEGFWLNGKPYPTPLIGANRHQDFALIGNALPNSLHYRDAVKLKQAGLKVIRNAHYPQDPAFMDACDALGLFVIVNTPGWQFWNEKPIFEKRVYQDIRQMVRRDKNRASLWFWEPVLNETWYPDYFAKKCLDIVQEEFPYESNYTACDEQAKGSEHFPILYTHPANGDENWGIKTMDSTKNYFTREWGDNVDDWNSQNSPSRVNRVWGEVPMLIQAQHYAHPPYQYTCYNTLYQTPRQHFGGCLWHSFDHQRGYHPDPFYGGIMDAFRQPKYAYYLFQAQQKEQPMVFIAHQMTPFSPKDVTVYSNCDTVLLKVNENDTTYQYTHIPKQGMPSPIIVFENAYNFMTGKALARSNKQQEIYLLAEGIKNGKVVARHKVSPAFRPEKLLLWVDDNGLSLQADGSDIITVIAAVADKQNVIKRLNNAIIRFEIEGEGRLLGSQAMGSNPTPIAWGTAPTLVQSTLKAGKIKLTARLLIEGLQTPLSATLVIESQKPTIPLLYDPQEASHIKEETSSILPSANDTLLRAKQQESKAKLKEVEKQQTEFGEDN